MTDERDGTDARRIVGGRHGSPHVIVAFPFAHINTAPERYDIEVLEGLSAAVSALAGHVRSLAERHDDAEAAVIADEAADIETAVLALLDAAEDHGM
ncbi:MAG: hypothetical protein IT198_17795 [Acidimicrobiia bacterium]|nr:hypothetical protein [Acidimicrobiia bacterium]